MIKKNCFKDRCKIQNNKQKKTYDFENDLDLGDKLKNRERKNDKMKAKMRQFEEDLKIKNNGKGIVFEGNIFDDGMSINTWQISEDSLVGDNKKKK